MKKVFVFFAALFLFTACSSNQGGDKKIEKVPKSYAVTDIDIQGSYDGGLKNGKAHGIGIAKGKDTYEGEFYEGKKEGKGKYIWGDTGSSYEGEFKDDLSDGIGTYKTTGGFIYVGEHKKGTMTGKGKKTYANGSYVEGDFLKGVLNGEGKALEPSGNYIEGSFKNGKMDGFMKYKMKNGAYMEGNCRDDRLTGKWLITIESLGINGEMNFKENKLNGLARLVFPNGSVEIEMKENVTDGKYKIVIDNRFFLEGTAEKNEIISYKLTDESGREIGPEDPEMEEIQQEFMKMGGLFEEIKRIFEKGLPKMSVR